MFYTSFGGTYPPGNSVTIRGGWVFEDLRGVPYTPAGGTMDTPVVGKMVWSRVGQQPADNATVAPYFFPSRTQQVNVHVE